MKKISNNIYSKITLCIAIILFSSSSYAFITTRSEEMEIKCSENPSKPLETAQEGKADVELNITLSGLRANKQQKIIKINDENTYSEEDLENSFESEKEELSKKPQVYAKVECINHQRKGILTSSGMQFSCPTGDGMQIKMILPKDPEMYGVFTLTSTQRGKCYPGGWCTK
ncbi:MAG: hypothetical protein KKE11_03975 [Gammaproteobacteria bacterium]|nr:hypothetical protein [Gammaproteobacteria bacterium]